jgi:chromosome segregation protein
LKHPLDRSVFMFLKSLEIRGFKSFADKTDLNFKSGVTAVVGPNGSGKSNISDAVRWVLGEQSVKSLRGGKMEDVIFAGTQFRKPVGLAQVSLTFDNSQFEIPIDYNDVTISRRLYRSGDSEYYINNTQCRLKDISELFMDTGIGKEGYSIIGQGKIDAILSGKADERRGLLEEAAGIVKFKSRKEEAEKRLNNTDQNLVRINDILSTYEERIEPLRVDSEKAKKFLDFSEALKTREISLILFSTQKLEEKLTIQKSDLEKIHAELEEFMKQKNEYRNKLNSFSEELEEHENKNNAEKDAYYKAKNGYQGTNSEIELLNERILNLKVHIERTLKDLEDIKLKLQNMQQNKNNIEALLDTHIKEQTSLNNEIKEFEKNIEVLNKNIQTEEKNRNALREEAIELLRNISENKNNITILQNNKDTLQKKFQGMEQDCENYTNSIKINSNTKLALESEIIKLLKNAKDEEEDIRLAKKEMQKHSLSLTSEEQNLKNNVGVLNKLEASHTLLLNFEKQFEGYTKAVKNLMQHIEAGKISGVSKNCYVLGEVISVESRLETAIEISLGGAISDIITKDENVAKKLINYLKQNSLGRATFLPLDILQYKQLVLANSLKAIKGFVGVASELIQYDSKFAAAIKYVLGRTIIAEDMDSALNIAKAGGYSYKIVTLSGEVVNPGGSLTGGSIYNKSTNIIGRKREIEELEEKMVITKKAIGDGNLKVQDFRNSIKALDEKILNLKDDIHFKQIEVTKLQGRITAISDEEAKIKNSLATAKSEMANLESKIAQFDQDIQRSTDIILKLTKAEEENEKAIEVYEGSVKGNLERAEAIKSKHMELKIKKAQMDEVASNKIKELERISNELEEVRKKEKEYCSEVTSSKESIEKNENAVLELIGKLKKMELEIKESEGKFEANEIKRIEIKEKIKNFEAKYEDINAVIIRKEEEGHRLDINLAKQEAEKEALILKLNEEFEITFAEAEKFRMEIESIDKLKNEISSLKGRITALGVVNLGAIEEYEQTKEKYGFMSEQKEDLMRAKEELLGVIDEMTTRMKEMFKENFKVLRENFNETFKELFKGGSADLILSDGDELTAAIDITVQPPGKKLQNINLMSGGEKVLSAIALLFAILKMKPTPFCILDEIEAALDDANVFRYAEFLKKFSKNIQFIVITHRKGTMEASDVLYGVTMEEKGVSKIVSVDLSGV